MMIDLYIEMMIDLYIEDAVVTQSYATALTCMYRVAIEMAHFAGANGFEVRFDPVGWNNLRCYVEGEDNVALLQLRFPDYIEKIHF
jgi:hypothetical protein